MTNTISTLLRVRSLALRAGAALVLGTGLTALSATPASAQVVIPAGCPPVPAGYTVDDFRALPNLGTLASPYFVPGGQRKYTIGTSGADVIEGNALGDVVCAGGGNDVVKGHAGDDVIYGLGGSDSLQGNEAADDIVGGPENDTLFGDGPTPTQFDTNDKLKGEAGDDTMTGGAGFDDLRGNGGVDDGDGEGGGGRCDATVEQTTNC